MAYKPPPRTTPTTRVALAVLFLGCLGAALFAYWAICP
jgi:hypothetical protein